MKVEQKMKRGRQNTVKSLRLSKKNCLFEQIIRLNDYVIRLYIRNIRLYDQIVLLWNKISLVDQIIRKTTRICL